MTVEISKQEIFNEVEKRTSLEGSMIPERFDRVWASPYDGELLESYWIEGYTAVIQLLKKYLSSDSVAYTLSSFDKDETLTIETVMPDRYNTLFDGSVSTDVKMLIACNIVASWLDVKLPEAAKKYSDEAEDYAEDLQKKLLYRKEPTNTAVAADVDAESIGVEEVGLRRGRSDYELIESVAEEVMTPAKEDTEPLVQVHCECQLNRYIKDCCDGFCN